VKVRSADGLALELHIRGDEAAPPVLLVHGFGGSGRAWGEPVLSALAASHRVLAPDLVGHGRSEDPSGAERVQLGRVLDDLERVLDAAGVEACAWIGYSMGGRIALAGAVERSARVRRLVLESASPGLATEAQRRARRAQDDELARRIEQLGIDAWVEEWERSPLFAGRLALAAEVREPFVALRRANRAASLAAWLRGLGQGSQPSSWERLREIERPVLLVTGSEDERYGAIAREMAGLMPAARHVAVPSAGHTVHLEDPAAWLAAVSPFLDGADVA
jgi:2-succinyl-6-hydroxy-2,4-cyclohexadiene-1-carboxylate synthase